MADDPKIRIEIFIVYLNLLTEQKLLGPYDCFLLLQPIDNDRLNNFSYF